jgi:hypothetical protein
MLGLDRQSRTSTSRQSAADGQATPDARLKVVAANTRTGKQQQAKPDMMAGMMQPHLESTQDQWKPHRISS